jgi:hypothetical protein
MAKNLAGAGMGVALAALCVLAWPARAAIQLEPGEWQDTETGTENGQLAKTAVTTECMTAQDAKDPVKALTKLKDTAGQQCKTMNVRESGNMLSFDMECGDAKTMLIAVSMTMTFLNSRHYTGAVKSNITFAGKKMTTDKQIDSKWMSATCKKQP